jgi:hypothetical protein
MKHSKLYEDLNSAIAYGWVLGWYAGCRGETSDKGKIQATEDIKANNPKIVTACNEYDTLKAKAELLEKALEKITKHAYKGIVVSTAYQALEDAKELK